MQSLELFSGAGGLARGLENAGFKHAKFVEFNKHACNSLRENFDADLVFEGDIGQFDFQSVNNIDLIAGGPPCQPFSMAGKHLANDDNRDMFPFATRSISIHQPKAFIFENVKGLLRPSFSKYFQYVILRMTFPEVAVYEAENWEKHFDRLSKINWNSYLGVKYRVQHKLLNAANFGIPQIRERVFIVGIRSDIETQWEYPDATHSASALYNEQFVSKIYWERHGVKALEKPVGDCPNFRKAGDPELQFEQPLLPWKTVRDILSKVPHPADQHSIVDHQFRDGAKSYPGHTGSYIDLPAKTLKAGGHGVPGGENMIRYENGKVRYFTVYEGKLLQTFEPDYIITGSWGEGMRQIGNAVPTLLAQKLGQKLMQTIANSSELVEVPLDTCKARRVEFAE